MQINTQSLRRIDAALKHLSDLKKQGGFLQNGILKKLQINQPGESNYVVGVMKGLKEKLTSSRAGLKKTEEEKVKMHSEFMQTKAKSLTSLTNTLTEKKILVTETRAKDTAVRQRIQRL